MQKRSECLNLPEFCALSTDKGFRGHHVAPARKLLSWELYPRVSHTYLVHLYLPGNFAQVTNRVAGEDCLSGFRTVLNHYRSQIRHAWHSSQSPVCNWWKVILGMFWIWWTDRQMKLSFNSLSLCLRNFKIACNTWKRLGIICPLILRPHWSSTVMKLVMLVLEQVTLWLLESVVEDTALWDCLLCAMESLPGPGSAPRCPISDTCSSRHCLAGAASARVASKHLQTHFDAACIATQTSSINWIQIDS